MVLSVLQSGSVMCAAGDNSKMFCQVTIMKVGSKMTMLMCLPGELCSKMTTTIYLLVITAKCACDG